MKSWFKKAAYLTREIVGDGKLITKIKFIELRSGGHAAREAYARDFLRRHASLIVPEEEAAQRPEFEKLLGEVAGLACKANVKCPRVVLMAGAGGRYLDGSPAMICDDILLVPEIALYAFKSSELRAIIGHELGHVVNGDVSKAPRLFSPRSHDAEFAADEFSVNLTGDRESMVTALRQGGIDYEDSSTHPSNRARIERINRNSELYAPGTFSGRVADKERDANSERQR